MATTTPHRILFGLPLAGSSGGCFAGPDTLCTAPEETVFSCQCKSKLASVCASSDKGRLAYGQYRFGTSISEIAIPPKHPFDPGLVSGQVSSGAHGDSEDYCFQKRGVLVQNSNLVGDAECEVQLCQNPSIQGREGHLTL